MGNNRQNFLLILLVHHLLVELYENLLQKIICCETVDKFYEELLTYHILIRLHRDLEEFYFARQGLVFKEAPDAVQGAVADFNMIKIQTQRFQTLIHPYRTNQFINSSIIYLSQTTTN